MIKLTPPLKRRITQDWRNLFPEMAVFRPMWLLRRVGPLVQGIALERSSAGTVYLPIIHIHDLSKPFPNVSLSLSQSLRSRRSGSEDPIAVQFHDRLHIEAAHRLASTSLLPLRGDLTVDDVVQAYARYRSMREPTSGLPVSYFESAVRLLAWTGRTEEGLRVLSGYVRELRAALNGLADAPDDLESWERSMRDVLANPATVRETAAEQIVALKVDRLPMSLLV
jgi:hypothetical protein